MIAAFLEGVNGILLPCSMVLLIPVMAAPLIAGRLPLLAVAAAGAGATGVMWLRAAQLVPGPVETVLAPVVGFAVVALGLMSVRGTDRAVAPLGAAFGLGLLAGLIWLPCVGVELGGILTSAGQRMPSSVLGLGAYALGVLVPALAAALLLIVIRPRGTTQHLVHRGGVALAVLVALLPVTGLDDRFVGWLVQLSVS